MYTRKSTAGLSERQWLQLRKTGIGGSDAGAVCGLNPYASPMAVFQDKTTDTTKSQDNEAMRQGRDLEEYVARRFTEATGLKVRRSNCMYRSMEHPWMIADVDRLIVGEDAGLECKTASAYSADKWKNGEIPAHYLIQCYTTEQHRQTLKINGWTDFTTVDITDEHGTATLPVTGGKWFTEMSVGASLPAYDSMVVLTHFKGHLMGGFGGSNKNIGIGCADGRVGKKMIHEKNNEFWGVTHEELMEKISESTKAVIDHFGRHITYVNVLRNMSVSCDCEGVAAQPVVTPNVGILASVDILAADQASVDMVAAMKEEDHHALMERMTTRHAFRQLSYMKELGMGNDRYILIDVDNGEARITAADAVADVVPFRA